MTIQYTPRGVCSRSFTIQVEDGLIQSVQVVGGCSGNLQGISMLLKGMPVEEAIRRMEGIRCGSKATSCPDQLAQALKQAQGCGYPASGRSALPDSFPKLRRCPSGPHLARRDSGSLRPLIPVSHTGRW